MIDSATQPDFTSSTSPSSVAARRPDPAPGSNAALEGEVARLIVEALGLDVDPAAIDPTARLYSEGLGLDSIDILEIALVVSKKYGFQLRSDDENNQKIFGSLRNLSEHIAAHRTKLGRAS